MTAKATSILGLNQQPHHRSNRRPARNSPLSKVRRLPMMATAVPVLGPNQ